LVPHPGIAHQDDNVAEKLKGSPSPGAGLSSFEQLAFCCIIKPKIPPMLLHHFDFGAWPIIFHSSALWSIRRSVRKPQLAFAVEPGNFDCSAQSPVIWFTRTSTTGVAFSSRHPLR
jgi:hypothetical protein